MTRRSLRLIALAAVVLLVMPLAARADSQPQATDLTQLFHDQGLTLDAMQVVEVGGIVIIRGRTGDQAQAVQAARIAQSLGYARVANLVQVTAPVDDAAIQRSAERELAIHRSLDGCRLHVNSQGGIVTVAGNVNNELQKDLAVELIRNLNGVRGVRSTLQRF